jgi:hypothetical protein
MPSDAHEHKTRRPCDGSIHAALKREGVAVRRAMAAEHAERIDNYFLKLAYEER